jgi:hypothetical protein
MATKRKKEPENIVERLAERGEEAVSRLLGELSPRISAAFDRAMSTKGRVDSASRTALTQLGLAAADEIKDLRSQLERVEKRLARLEGGSASAEKGTSGKGGAKKAETKRTPTAKKSSTRVTKETEKAPSPPPGRAIGGGTGRGSSGGTPPAA